ncbi:hypothetical protein [Bowmanella denitrificans]|uniref:hypothetical protein n=1 Tax=Bowmanella denitrificans TaxID=366582 RepID=UPI000C9B2463|nr:hypothetical protein [Bowmanella denitrificans]
MKALPYLSIAFSLLYSSVTQAEFYQCYGVEVKRVAVERNRDDNFGFQNNMVIMLSAKCGGYEWTHTEISHPLMSQFLNIALAAKTTGIKVNIGVNTSTQISGEAGVKANQLAYIDLAG